MSLISNLSRILTPGRKYVPQIDGLRFVAIMAVLAYHIELLYAFHRGLMAGPLASGFWLNTVFAAGHYGVQLFFAISGFVVSLPFAKAAKGTRGSVSLHEFYLRRLTRIEPPYVIQLAAFSVLGIFVYRKLPSYPILYYSPDWFQTLANHIGASLSYSNGFIYGTHPYLNSVLWSLEVEVQFYVLAPLFSRVFCLRRRIVRRGAIVAVIILGLAISLAFGHFYRVWTSLLGNLHFFAIGFLFADLYAEEELEVSPNCSSLWWDVLWLASICLLILWPSDIWLPIPICLSFVAAFRGYLTPQLLAVSWITVVGGMCYTIYMYHLPLLSAGIKLTERLRLGNLSLDLGAQFILLTLLIVLASAGLFVAFERPFMNHTWPQQLLDLLRTASGKFRVTAHRRMPAP